MSETLIATSVSGVLFCLLAGQPLLILGATGPVIVFEEALYSVSIIVSSFISQFITCTCLMWNVFSVFRFPKIIF